MRSPTLTGAALLMGTLLTGCGADSPTAENASPLSPDAALTAMHVVSTIPLDETFVSPCNGEPIHFTGTLSAEDTFVGDSPDYYLHHELQVLVSETGTGLTTGASYIVHDVNHEGFNSPTAPAPNFTFTYRENYFFNSTTPGLSFSGRFFVHYLALPSGEFFVTRDSGSLECRA